MAFNAGSSDQVKEYTGPTTVNAGRWRTSLGGVPTMTSSFTINNGGQLTQISTGDYTFGASSAVPLNLNGFGPVSGPFAPFAGAIRPNTGLVFTIENDVVVQTDASIALFGSATSLTLPGTISGPGRFYLDANAGEPTNHGTLTVTGSNTYMGGTSVVQGTLDVSGASATLGIGDVLVDGLSSNVNTGVYGTGKLVIESGVNDAIADDASLTLNIGNTFGGTASLGSGVNETIGSLILNGASQLPGRTYGSGTSGAMVQNDSYFLDTGMVTVGLLGDYNGNHSVDAADYIVWRKSYSSDTNMYDVWRSHYGNSLAGSGSSLSNVAVPEPSTVGAGRLALITLRG